MIPRWLFQAMLPDGGQRVITKARTNYYDLQAHVLMQFTAMTADGLAASPCKSRFIGLRLSPATETRQLFSPMLRFNSRNPEGWQWPGKYGPAQVPDRTRNTDRFRACDNNYILPPTTASAIGCFLKRWIRLFIHMPTI